MAYLLAGTSDVYDWTGSDWQRVGDLSEADQLGIDAGSLAQAGSVLDMQAQSGLYNYDGPRPDDTPPPPPPPPAEQAPAAAPATSFVWGGQTWSSADLYAFIGYLAAHGVAYETWAGNHPTAAAIFGVDYSDPTREPAAHSIGAALAAHLQAGATPEYAAAQVAALAAEQAARGFGAPQGAELVQAARDVADALAAAAPAASSPPPPPAAPLPSRDAGVDSYLAGDAIILDMADDEPSRELAGVVQTPTAAWLDLRDQLVKDMPFVGSHVRARGHQLRGVVASDLWSSST
jgi:hypothetical protein